ncbi:MAG: hypothetical protein IPN73_17875 [Saprospiraceae bacterium]|nr:hypothetical protein [Saprospiraceae bacterium]
MKFRLTLFLSFCFGFLLGQSDGMKTEYIGRKGYKEQIRENINRFNAENGITSKNRNKMNYDAYLKQKAIDKETSNAYGVLNGNWTNYPLLQSAKGMGRVECIAFHPSNPDIYYIGAAGGGVWKTTNGGVSYLPLTDDIPCGGIASIVVNPIDPNIVYILTGAGKSYQSNSSIGVFKSYDAGVHWVPTALQDSITTNYQEMVAFKLAMKPNDVNTLYACTNLGLFKTTNAGDSWTKVKSGEVWDIEFKPNNANVVYISGKGITYFYHCTDGGVSEASWTASTPFNSSGPFPILIDNFRAMSLAVSPAAPNQVGAVLVADIPDKSPHIVLYNTYAYNAVQMNYDTGNSPTIVSATCGTKIDTCWASGGGREYAELYIGDSNFGDAIVGGVQFYVQENYGGWDLKSKDCSTNAQLFHVDACMIAKNNGEIYVCNDGGVWKQTESYTPGGVWTDMTASIEIAQAYAIDGSPQDENIILMGLQDNGVHLRTATDYSQFIGGDGTAVAIDQTNANIFFGTIQNGEFFKKSVNGTVTGMRVPGPSCACPDSALYSGTFNFSKCFQVDKNDPMKLYYMKRDMYYSGNRGNNWNRIVTGFSNPVKMMRVARSDNSDWYIISDNDLMFKTTNFGTTINLVNTPVSASVISDIYISEDNSSVVYISVLGNVADKKLYKSEDGGATWINWSSGLPNVSILCIAFDEYSKELYVGTDIGVYVRPFNKEQWIPFNNFLPITQVFDLYINPGAETIYASLFGRGVSTSPLFAYISCTSYQESLGGTINFRQNLSAMDSIKSTTTILGTAQSNVRYSVQDGYIRMSPGFQAQSISNFSAVIEPCGGSIGTSFREGTKDSKADTQQKDKAIEVNLPLPLPPKKE